MALTDVIVTGVAAVLGSGTVVAALNYISNRKKVSSESRVLTATEGVQIGLVTVQELEAKLGYLTRVISVLEQHNVRLEGDLDHQYKLNVQLSARMRELNTRCDKLEVVIRKLCIENGLDPDQYLS